MPVQMIELEEVTMIELSDDALEALEGGNRFWTNSTCGAYNTCPDHAGC